MGGCGLRSTFGLVVLNLMILMSTVGIRSDAAAATVRYEISVETGDTFDWADTDANVFLQIFGATNTTGRLALSTPLTGQDPFQLGSTDVFHVIAMDVGQIVNITIGHDNTGDGAGWYVNSVDVLIRSRGERYVFSINGRMTTTTQLDVYPGQVLTCSSEWQQLYNTTDPQLDFDCARDIDRCLPGSIVVLTQQAMDSIPNCSCSDTHFPGTFFLGDEDLMFAHGWNSTGTVVNKTHHDVFTLKCWPLDYFPCTDGLHLCQLTCSSQYGNNSVPTPLLCSDPGSSLVESPLESSLFIPATGVISDSASSSFIVETDKTKSSLTYISSSDYILATDSMTFSTIRIGTSDQSTDVAATDNKHGVISASDSIFVSSVPGSIIYSTKSITETGTYLPGSKEGDISTISEATASVETIPPITYPKVSDVISTLIPEATATGAMSLEFSSIDPLLSTSVTTMGNTAMGTNATETKLSASELFSSTLTSDATFSELDSSTDFDFHSIPTTSDASGTAYSSHLTTEPLMRDSTTASTSTAPTCQRKRFVRCGCQFPRQLTRNLQNKYNSTMAEIKAKLAEDLRKEHTLNRSLLSRARNKKISKADHRLTSQVAGYLAISVLVALLALMLACDMNTIGRMKSSRRQRKDKESQK